MGALKIDFPLDWEEFSSTGIFLFILPIRTCAHSLYLIIWTLSNYNSQDNYTALHIAVESCKPAVVETLLGYGADVHVRGGKQRETALHIAARIPDGKLKLFYCPFLN